MKSEIRILFVLPGLSISGGVGVVLQHANRLQKRGYNVALVTLGNTSEISWFPNDVPVYLRHDDHDKFAGFWDVVIATQFGTVQFVEKEILSRRKIYFVQSDERRFDLSAYQRAMCIESYQKTNFEYMTEALWIGKWLKNEFGHEAHYVPNGVDETIFFSSNIDSSKKRKRVLIEGAINVPEKGMYDAYEAVKDLDVDLWIVSNNGRPPKDWKYERFMESVPMTEMQSVYSSCDVFLKMSRVEGFFGPPLEAMACGLPVVVAKCTGYDEYIVHEYNALVVEPEDVDGALHAVRQVLESDVLSQSLVESGKLTSKQWSWERSIDHFESLLKNEKGDGTIFDKSECVYCFQNSLQRAVATYNVRDDSSLSAIVKRDAYIDALHQQIDFHKNSLQRLRSSKFWRLRDFYINFKTTVFPFLKDQSDFLNERKELHEPSGGQSNITSEKVDAILFDSGLFSRKHETLTVLVHYDSKDRVDMTFFYYLRALSLFSDVLVVSTATGLSSVAIGSLLKYASRVVVKENVGYDFRSWAKGLEMTDYGVYDRIILTNDSVFGPLFDLQEIIALMETKDYDVWSLTDSHARGYHLQSYFMVYGKRPISENFFDTAFTHDGDIITKDDLINAYEVGMTKKFYAKAYRIGAFCNQEEMYSEIVKRKLTQYNYDVNLNCTHMWWEFLIVYKQFPFIKRELIQKNPTGVDISLVRNVIQTYADYDVTLIDRYLEKYSQK